MPRTSALLVILYGLTLLLASSCAGHKRQTPEHGPSAPAEESAGADPGEPTTSPGVVVVELTDPGQEPRRALGFQVEAGQRDLVRIVDTDEADEFSGYCATEVTDVTADGLIHAWRFCLAGLKPEANLTWDELMEIRQELDALPDEDYWLAASHMILTDKILVLDQKGELHRAEYKRDRPEEFPHPYSFFSMGTAPPMRHPDHLSIPLPAQPVAEGATWRVIWRDEAPVAIDARLVEITDAGFRVAFDFEHLEFRLPQSGERTEIQGGRGTGQMRVHRGRLTPEISWAGDIRVFTDLWDAYPEEERLSPPETYHTEYGFEARHVEEDGRE